MPMFNYFQNKIVDWRYRGQAFTPSVTAFFGLIFANKGFAAVSTAYALNDYVVPVVSTGRLYKATTAGTSGAAAPVWPTTDGGTVTDGTVVWTEQTIAIKAGTFPEVVGGAYARVGVATSLVNFAGTQGAGTTVASTGTSGTTSNNGAITFPAPTANWGTIFGMVDMDAATAGNGYHFQALTVPKTVNNGDPAPSFAAAAFSEQYL